MTAPHEGKRRVLGALRLVREGSFRAPDSYPCLGVRCDNPRAVFEFMRPYAEREEVEVFWILALDAQRQIIRERPLAVSRGTLNGALVHPREVFRLAIHTNAASIIGVHNHPSGDPTPSLDDKLITSQLVAAGKTLDIPFLDHVIIGAGRYVAFSESGLL